MRDDRGATAVEFALVMIPLIVLVFGIIQYGLYFWASQGGNDIARSAARWAAVGEHPDCSEFTAEVSDQVADIGGDDTNVTRTYDQADPDELAIGDTVTVKVEFKSIDLHFPFLPFIDDGWVQSTAKARVDYIPTSTDPVDCS